MRALCAPPALLNEWGREPHGERTSAWWELFVDLVLVAAVGNLSAALRAGGATSSAGRVELAACFVLLQGGWRAYAEYATRYAHSDLAHAGLLFTFMVGTAVSAGSEGLLPFAAGVAIQRAALVAMNAVAAWWLPRARAHAAVFVASNGAVCCIAAAACALPTARPGLIIAAAVFDVVYLYLFVASVELGALGRASVVPVNIEHLADREGCFVMVVLGESVVSSIQEYRKKRTPGSGEGDRSYVWVTAVCLALPFALALVYFGVAASRKVHALRRSMLTGCAFLTSHTVLCAALLVAGAALHELAEAAEEGMAAPRLASVVLCSASAVAMLTMAVIRALHFWGRHPAPSDPPVVKNVKWAWWSLFPASTVALAASAALYGLTSHEVSPSLVLLNVAGLVVSHVLVETLCMHRLKLLGYDRLDDIEFDSHNEDFDDTEAILLSAAE